MRRQLLPLLGAALLLPLAACGSPAAEQEQEQEGEQGEGEREQGEDEAEDGG